ncbi:MAG TPA: ABC transporter substrate-binding protein [Gaiellaceae bacterium]|jgi:multiple sugar transport system substrate-binding protein|nr:ABC transporter substrate-binding protein [Gaiellaceae bacterium]
MRRIAVPLLAAVVLGAAVAGAARLSSARADTHAAKKTKLTVWVGWSARELKEFKGVVAEYQAKHPELQIKVVGSINDTKITNAIRSGNAPDVVSSFTSSMVGVFCGTGAWIDLMPFLKKDHVSLSQFPKTSLYYTQFKGKRCALPLLADSYGLYYNKTLFRKAGIKSPPKTFSELTADAKKLTQRSGGKIKVIGYNPFWGFYSGNFTDMTNYAPLFGAQYYNNKGKAVLASRFAWSKVLRWQKSLIDWYGYSNVVRFQSGLGDEFSASNAFEIGKIAMMMDGEWRVAFIKAEHPDLNYGTAPMPVDDAHKNLYGAGSVNGTIIGIPKGGHNVDQAWALVKYLTTNDHALAKFSNGIRNVPSTRSSGKSPELKPDKRFATFVRIFNNPHSATAPITAAGAAPGTLIGRFTVRWQAGKVKNLHQGLKTLDKQVDKVNAQAGGGVP